MNTLKVGGDMRTFEEKWKWKTRCNLLEIPGNTELHKKIEKIMT